MKSVAFLAALLLTTSARPAEIAPVAVRTTTPKAVTATLPYQVPGRTEPLEAATIFTRATGMVKERNFDIGDAVKSGDVLAVIAVPELDRAVEAVRAGVEQAVARAENARVSAQRATTLLESQSASREEADQRNATATELAAAVRVVRAARTRAAVSDEPVLGVARRLLAGARRRPRPMPCPRA